MIVLTNNEGKSGIGTTVRLLREEDPPWTRSRRACAWSRTMKTCARSAAAAGPICWAKWSWTHRSWTGRRCARAPWAAEGDSLHPVSVARQVMERLPHEHALVGEKARRVSWPKSASSRANCWRIHSARRTPAVVRRRGPSPPDRANSPDVPLTRIAARTRSTRKSARSMLTVFLALDAGGQYPRPEPARRDGDGNIRTAGRTAPLIGMPAPAIPALRRLRPHRRGGMTMRAGTARRSCWTAENAAGGVNAPSRKRSTTCARSRAA